MSPALLYAVAVVNAGVESNGRVTVWPWTVRIDGEPRRFSSAGAAAAMARWAADQGRDVALGLFALRMPDRAVGRRILGEQSQLREGTRQIARCLERHNRDEALALGRCLAPTSGEADSVALGRRVLAIAQRLERGLAPGAGLLCGIPSEGSKGKVAGLVIKHALRAGLDPAFALAIAQSESRFRQSARSPAGAIGVMQLMPATARRFGVDPYDLEQNIAGGMRYLAWLAEEFDDVPALVAAGYNAGEGAVHKFNNKVPDYRETQAYVPRVIAARETFLCTH